MGFKFNKSCKRCLGSGTIVGEPPGLDFPCECYTGIKKKTETGEITGSLRLRRIANTLSQQAALQAPADRGPGNTVCEGCGGGCSQTRRLCAECLNMSAEAVSEAAVAAEEVQ